MRTSTRDKKDACFSGPHHVAYLLTGDIPHEKNKTDNADNAVENDGFADADM